MLSTIPLQKLSKTFLQIFQLQGTFYTPKNNALFPDINLGLTLGNGVFENVNDTWLRWCDADGNLIKTGDELAIEKNVQISQKNAEVSQKNAEISQNILEISQKNAEISQLKQALLLAIEMSLKIKFGDEAIAILSEVSAINNMKFLEEIVSQIPHISSTDELQKLYSEKKEEL
ncbi:hypothetical protein [Okeania sp.]|uniref:hypothetical protein n=1 Tax=Okeania sp. TaxID=3100323 RepID=UPI002B4AFC12|nr:hypothetical protein [Okeania sp.]MEB3341088.1 hypothetical protein [Okeania sp.]